VHKNKVRDLVATLIFAAVMVPYVGYVINRSMPFVKDPRGMSAVGLVGLLLMIIAFGGRESFDRGFVAADRDCRRRFWPRVLRADP